MLRIRAFVASFVAVQVVTGFVVPVASPGRVLPKLKVVSDGLEERQDVLPQAKSADFIVEKWPFVKDYPDFLAAVERGTKGPISTNGPVLVQWAATWARMARAIVLARGPDTLADNFTFYSPSTGTLDKRQYLSLLKTLDVAFNDHAVLPRSFFALGDGTVAYSYSWRSMHDGPLRYTGGESIPATNIRALSDIELATVTFTPTGKLLSHASGLWIAGTDAVVDPEMITEIGVLERKVAGQLEKIASLAGQEHTIAYTKAVEDVSNMETRLNVLRGKCDIVSNTGSKGGLDGLLHAIGLPLPDDIATLFGAAPWDKVEGTRSHGYSVPSEVAGTAVTV